MASNVDLVASSAPRTALRSALASWLVDRPVPASIPIEVQPPRDAAHGEYATNLPLRAAKALGKKPIEVANDLARDLEIEGVTASAAPPGFVNFRLSDARLVAQSI